MSKCTLFQVDSWEQGLVVTLLKPISSLADSTILREMEAIVHSVEQQPVQGLIVDFADVPYFGSSLLEALRWLWQTVQAQGGEVVLCNVSPVGQEILGVTKFDRLWPIFADLSAAKAHFSL